MLFAAYLLLGGLVGFLAGLLGVGGGIIIVPCLLFVLTRFVGVPEDLSMHIAIGTSLATIILTAALTTRAHHQKGAVLWPLFWSFTPGILIGALIIGPFLAHYLSGKWLKDIFALFCVAMSIQMWLTVHQQDQAVTGTHRFFKPGIVIGALSAILGIAGGSLAAVLLNWYRYSMRHIVATSAAIGLPVAVCGALGAAVTGWHVSGLPQGSLGYIYGPAFLGIVLGSFCTSQIGTYLAHQLPVHYLKRIFSLVLVVIAVELLIG